MPHGNPMQRCRQFVVAGGSGVQPGQVSVDQPHPCRTPADDDHKIAALRHYVDTAKHIAAWNGEDTTRRGS